jgi:hypothetical protein
MSAKPLLQQFQDDINLVVDKYRDQGLSNGEAIGALEIVKLDLWNTTPTIDDDERKDF